MKLHYFLSYAHNDKVLVDKFNDELKTALSIIPDYEFEQWRDVDVLLPGDRWFDEIQRALAECDFGMLLVSNHFLSRPFIRQYELPILAPKVDDGPGDKFCIPVGLQQVVNSDAVNAWLDGRQVFSHQSRWFADCKKQQRVHFVNALVNQTLLVIEKRVVV